MHGNRIWSPKTLFADSMAGLVVFFVALPLCLGIAQASNAPLLSGILAGIVGGLIVGALSGSHTSVSGPAAGLTAVVAQQISNLGSFETFVLAVAIGGCLQIAMGICRAGNLAAFVPSSVIQGLLAAIGVILILKQTPHLLGHDADPEGEMSFTQPDQENTFSEILQLFGDIHPGAALVGIASLALLITWDRIKLLKKFPVPAPLIVVVMGIGLAEWLRRWEGHWVIGPSHRVDVPISESLAVFWGLIKTPDFSQLTNPAVYTAAMTIAIVASLETLLNVQAVDKLDPYQRETPENRELIAQGAGNMVAGLIGGLPMTSVIVRSSANVNAGAKTKLSALIHGALLFGCVVWLPRWLNLIPTSCLAAILLMTGFKLANPRMMIDMWREGRYRFMPFLITLTAIVFTDLLVGVLIGLGMTTAFILNSNIRRPIRRIVEQHVSGELTRIKLANQVSFLNRAALERALRQAPRGSNILLDASDTDYIDPDILSLVREFRDKIAPAHGVRVSLVGFRDKYQLNDDLQFVDHTTREMQDQLTPDRVLSILIEGNKRFRSGKQLQRDLGRQLQATSTGQHPMAVVLSCIDSRSPAELIFDLGLGDIFSVRVAGNITSPKVLGSMEYGTAVAGARLILVLGHTKCGAVTAAVNFAYSKQSANAVTGCQFLEPIVHDIQLAIEPQMPTKYTELPDDRRAEYVDQIARRNVARCVHEILRQSDTIRRLADEGRIAVVGAMYDITTGEIDVLKLDSAGLTAA